MKKHFVLYITAGVILLAVLFGAGGWVIGRAGMFGGGLVAIPAEDYQDYRSNRLVEDVVSLVEDHYYTPIDRERLYEGAARGVLNALQDEYSYYMNAEEFKALTDYSWGIMYGIGVEYTQNEDGTIEVVAVIQGAGAQKAGVKVGDVITHVDGVVLDQDMNTLDVQNMILGEEGTEVQIRVYREGETKDFTITRAALEKDSVSYSLDGEIGYIHIQQFYPNTPEKFEEAINGLTEQGAKGLLIDLRYNPGGIFEAAIQMADIILPEADVVSTENRGVTMNVYESDEAHIDLPIVILVNEYSASASEVFAAALQDNDAAKLVGTTTYGKGVVQTLLQLPEYESAMRITTEEYITPNGRAINGVGIEPDVEVDLPEALLNGEEELTHETDTQYQKGMEVLQEMLGE
ncbi:MAG: S41 family peptidase [Christensenellales bacterium]|jgi:carboxyl-terminal processing protease